MRGKTGRKSLYRTVRRLHAHSEAIVLSLVNSYCGDIMQFCAGTKLKGSDFKALLIKNLWKRHKNRNFAID